MITPVATVVAVLILGASAFMWWRGQLRSRAAKVAIGGLIVVFAYLAFVGGLGAA